MNLNLQDENGNNPQLTVNAQNKTIRITPGSHANKIFEATTGKIKIKLASVVILFWML